MNKKEIDTSYSGIVQYVQDDPEKARELALRLISQYKSAEEKIEKCEKELSSAQSWRSSALCGLHHIGKISGLPMHNYIIATPKEIFDIGPTDIKIKSNVLK